MICPLTLMNQTITQTDHGCRIKDVEFIWAKNSKEFLFSNSILIHGEKPVIVDPSASFTYIEQLAKAHYVNIVLNTHRHGDHRSLNQLFKSAVFACHENDANAISDFAIYAKDADKQSNSFYVQWMQDTFKQYKIVDCMVSMRLNDNDTIDTGSEKIHIIHIPGHTPGHVALFFEKADLLFTSDIDLTPYGPWYAAVVSDINDFKKSIERVKNIECTYYAPSHGERIYDREKFLQKLERFERCFSDREEKILEVLKQEPLNLLHLSSHPIVYRKGSLNDPLKCYFQLRMVEKHLEDLLQRGLIVQDDDRFVVV